MGAEGITTEVGDGGICASGEEFLGENEGKEEQNNWLREEGQVKETRM
jgi:hypothetical protein